MNIERFAKLFAGYEARFGQYVIHGRDKEGGKMQGQAKTLDRPIKISDYAAHLEGKAGVGVIPLRKDNLINFASIDLDEYPGSDKFKVARKDDETDENYSARVSIMHMEWANKITILIREEPLVASWSKSGGLHLWLFSEDGIAADVAITYLQNVAQEIGHGGCEVFPKQAHRHSENDVGNWINLPMFGDTRKARIVTETDIGYEVEEIDYDMFLKVAEHYAAQNTQDSIEKLNSGKSAMSATASDRWYDGPPCLQRLIIGDPKKVDRLRRTYQKKVRDADFPDEATAERARVWLEKQEAALSPQLAEGGRDTTFFNVAMYLSRRELQVFEGKINDTKLKQLEELVVVAHDDWSTATGNPGLKAGELKRIAKQGLKDGWNYTCNQPPLKNFCSRKSCLERAYGVGSRKDDTEMQLDGFTVVTSKPPTFFFNVDGARVSMSSEEITDQRRFSTSLLNQALKLWTPIPTRQFTKLLGTALDAAPRVEPLPETDLREIVAQHLLDYLKRNKILRGSGHESKFFEPGKPLWAEDEASAWFKLAKFDEYLKSKGVKILRTPLQTLLVEDLKVKSRNTTLQTKDETKSVRPYIADIKLIEKVVNP